MVTSMGFLDVVCKFVTCLWCVGTVWLKLMDAVVTDDFTDSECFEVGQSYELCFREPTSPGVPTGISLSLNGCHLGWVKQSSRPAVEDILKQNVTVSCRVESRGKRWRRFDDRLGLYRQWQEGEALFWADLD